MRLNRPIVASLAALGAAVCLASATLAQEPPGPPPAARDHAGWAEHQRGRQEARAKALHDILNIRADQEAAFQTFIAAIHPHDGEKREDADDMGPMEQLTLPERLDRMAAHMAAHQEEFQRHATAIKAFYSALRLEQQRAFDALPGLMMGDRHDSDEPDDIGGRGRFDGSHDGPHDAPPQG
jgi:hypothetical protein